VIDIKDYVVLKISPGKIADRSVGLPMLRLNVLAQAAFKIASAGMPVEIEFKSADFILHQLVDIVSKNGNLLLNLGPRPGWHYS
jgi:hypothetical protein